MRKRLTVIVLSIFLLSILLVCGNSASLPNDTESYVQQTKTTKKVSTDDPDARPAISGSVENMEEYDTVLLGFPNIEQGFNSVSCA